jgi:hypothetical protein
MAALDGDQGYPTRHQKKSPLPLDNAGAHAPPHPLITPPPHRRTWRLAVEERRIALEEERMLKEKKTEEQQLTIEIKKLAKEREDADRTIMFMNPSTLDDKYCAY